MKKILILILLITIVTATDFNITTTSDFDAGTKSFSSGNFEIETYTDSPFVEENVCQLGSMFGDSFSFTDSDGVTWKWIENSTLSTYSSKTVDINSTREGEMYLSTSRVGVSSGALRWQYNNKLTGDFDLRLSFNLTQLDAGDDRFGLEFYIDTDDYTQIFLQQGANGNRIFARTYVGGVQSYNTYGTTDKTYSLRMTRNSSTVYLYYDMNGGDSWTQIHTRSSFSTSDAMPMIYIHAGNADGTTSGYVDNFKVNEGNFVNEDYFLNGSWESAEQTLSSEHQLANTTIIYSNTNNSSYIDKIKFNLHDELNNTYLRDDSELISYWKLENLIDETLNHNLTNSGASVGAGYFNNGYVFDGLADYVYATDHDDFSFTDKKFTLNSWIYPTRYGGESTDH